MLHTFTRAALTAVLAEKQQHLEISLDNSVTHRPRSATLAASIALVVQPSAISKKDISMVQWIYEHHPPPGPVFSWFHSAIQSGNVEAAQFLVAKGYQFYHYDALTAAATAGNVEMVQWIHSLPHVKVTENVLSYAAFKGHFGLFRWLYANADGGLQQSFATMDYAARDGDLSSLQWLHEKQIGFCTSEAMDSAATNRHLAIVEWLHKNRTEGCSSYAMDGAATHGHLHVVDWLHANRWEGCLPTTLERTAACGHLDVVEWLYENGFPNRNTSAMDEAAMYNRLDVVKWLHENRSASGQYSLLFERRALIHCTVSKWPFIAALRTKEWCPWMHPKCVVSHSKIAVRPSAAALSMSFHANTLVQYS